MSAGFLKKRFFAVAGFATAFVFTVGAIFYAWFLVGITQIDVSKNFYFLVSDSTHLEASTHTAKYVGGAGYLLNFENRDYVAFSVYLKGEDGDWAKEAVSRNQQDVKLLVLNGGKLYLKKSSEKKNAQKIVGAFKSLYGNIEVLEQEISRLENGATQQSSKRILEILENKFSYLGEVYKEDFSVFSVVCKNAESLLKKAREEIVYAKELRYLQCELCASYVDLSEEFTL